MKMIKANRDRDLIAQTIFKCGEFAYELDKDFLTLPDFLRYTPICTGCCDENDNIDKGQNSMMVIQGSGSLPADYIKELLTSIFARLPDAIWHEQSKAK